MSDEEMKKAALALFPAGESLSHDQIGATLAGADGEDWRAVNGALYALEEEGVIKAVNGFWHRADDPAAEAHATRQFICQAIISLSGPATALEGFMDVSDRHREHNREWLGDLLATIERLRTVTVHLLRTEGA